MPAHDTLNVKGPAGHLVVDHRPALSQPLPYALSATRTVVARLVRPHMESQLISANPS